MPAAITVDQLGGVEPFLVGRRQNREKVGGEKSADHLGRTPQMAARH
jgi:hypothetical protein